MLALRKKCATPIVVYLLAVPLFASATPITLDILGGLERSENRSQESEAIEASVARALANVQLGELSRATEQLELLRMANPTSPVPLLGLAELSALQGLLDETSHWLDAAYEVAPSDWRVARAMANFHQASGHDKEAEHWMTSAITLAPQLARLRSNLGDIYSHQRRYESAIVAYTDAIQLDPEFVSAMVSRANVWLLLGKPQDALEDFNAATDLQPALPNARLGRALSLEAIGDSGAARVAYESVLEIEPDNAIARNNLAWLIVSTGADLELDLAAGHAERAVELAPEVAGFRDTLATVYRQQHRRQEAILEYRRAIELDPALESSAIALRELSENR